MWLCCGWFFLDPFMTTNNLEEGRAGGVNLPPLGGTLGFPSRSPRPRREDTAPHGCSSGGLPLLENPLNHSLLHGYTTASTQFFTAVFCQDHFVNLPPTTLSGPTELLIPLTKAPKSVNTRKGPCLINSPVIAVKMKFER